MKKKGLILILSIVLYAQATFVHAYTGTIQPGCTDGAVCGFAPFPNGSHSIIFTNISNNGFNLYYSVNSFSTPFLTAQNHNLVSGTDFQLQTFDSGSFNASINATYTAIQSQTGAPCAAISLVACRAVSGGGNEITFIISGTPPASVSVDFAPSSPPTIGTTTDFSAWHILTTGWTNATTATEYSPAVAYSNTATTTQNFVDSNAFTFTTSSLASFRLTKTHTLPVGTNWNAIAEIFDCPTFSSCSLISSSTIYNFTISSSSIFSTQIEICASLQAGDNFLIDPIGNIVVALCKAFLPSRAALSSFQTLQPLITSRAPTAYFYDIASSVSAISEGTSTAFLINASTTAAFSKVFAPIKSGLDWVLWLFFVFWAFHRIKMLDL